MQAASHEMEDAPEQIAPLGPMGAIFKLSSRVIGHSTDTMSRDGRTFALVPLEVLMALNTALQEFVAAEKANYEYLEAQVNEKLQRDADRESRRDRSVRNVA